MQILTIVNTGKISLKNWKLKNELIKIIKRKFGGNNMAPIFEDFPYTNFHELNIDWLLEVIQTMDSEIDDLKARVTALEEA